MEQLKLLFEREKDILRAIYGKFSKANNEKGYSVEKFDPMYFFLEDLPVSPNRFRPESVINDQVYLHAHTVLYTKVLQVNGELANLQIDNKEIFSQKETNQVHKKAIQKWIELQDLVNILFDSSVNQKASEKYTGIKQILEKKEGIFRMKIMGKRVNFSARSVISPDPYLDSDEIGLPLFIAKTLTFPERVNSQNMELMKQRVKNGPHIYPGALELTEKHIKKILENSTTEQRTLLANKLPIEKEHKVVHRHAQDGDIILFNRQPTLHKPSLMAYKVKILPKENTIRMHYVNCSGFNADFDGDEMNVHLLQNYLARSEGLNLALCDRQYILATNKSPIRGFIQDFIFAAVFISFKDTFFTQSDYCQLLYDSLFKIIEEDPQCNEVTLMKPAFFKPIKLWTGKQLFSNIMDYIATYEFNALETRTSKMNLKAKCRVNQNYFESVCVEESEVLIRNNELLKGLIDKNMIGASSFGLIHTFNELFGHVKTKLLVTAITRLCMNYLKIRGFTCGLSDLQLEVQAEKKRVQIMEKLHEKAILEQAKLLQVPCIKHDDYFESHDQSKFKKTFEENNKELLKKARQSAEEGDKLDQVVKSSTSKLQSEVSQETVGQGLLTKFPINNFSAMVLTGAKGSVLNHSQVSCNLGQQELEGKRVPLMHSGKTLPSFLPFDPNPRCGGFIGDRFLSGLRSQEFYFHCMAGREGLVDTAVKTSRSGYLQRILVKNLESLVVEYDNTVRDMDDKSLVQYYYGEDSLDPVKVNPVENPDFILQNFDTIVEELQQSNPESFLQLNDSDLNDENPYKNLGCISQKARARLEGFFKEKKKEFKIKKINEEIFRKVFNWLYFKSLVNHGEPVGAVAAQSFGEPSTQMTLNTFHLAGHGGANVTLGVPRLKELMTTKNTKNSIMFVPFKQEIEESVAEKVLKGYENVNLLQWVNRIGVRNWLHLKDEKGNGLRKNERVQKYAFEIELVDTQSIQRAFGLKEEHIKGAIQKFVEKFNKYLQKTISGKTEKSEKAEKIEKNDKKFKEDKDDVFALGCEIEDSIIHLTLDFPLNKKPPSFLNILEEILEGIKIKRQKNINNAHLYKENNGLTLQLEGLNFKSIWKNRKYFEVEKIGSNDIGIMSEVYGIEAGRNAWIKEVQTVFGHYGIKVDYRHAYLVADHLTFSGHVTPMSRIGIKHNNSALLKMSFETTMQFLIESTKNLETDLLHSCSASLVVGNPVKVGSGAFELRQLLQ